MNMMGLLRMMMVMKMIAMAVIFNTMKIEQGQCILFVINPCASSSSFSVRSRCK